MKLVHAGLKLQALLLSVLLELHCCESRTTSSFASSQSVCTGEPVQFTCTVVDYGLPLYSSSTFWRVSNSAVRCALSHYFQSDEDECEPFTARLIKLGDRRYFSNFTTIARRDLNNSLVQCFGPTNSSLVGNDTLKIIGPPSPPLLKLPADWIIETEDPDAYNVTVQWDLPLPGSINDNESFISGYLVTVRPEVLPCGGGTCVVTPGMRAFTRRELTLTMRTGQIYNVTIQSENCNGTQIGGASYYHITLQEPEIPAMCISCAVYNYSSKELISIDNQWSVLPSAPDIAPGLNGSVKYYEITVQSDSGYSVIERVQSSNGCTEKTCTHSFIPWRAANGSSYHISIAARNAVTLGQQRTCTPTPMSATNNLLQVEVFESGRNVLIQCRLLTTFTERVHCEVWYGADPSHHVLPYHDVSDNAGTGGDVLTIHLSHSLQDNTTYYYNISLAAVNGIQNLYTKVIHSFRIDCDPADLGTPLLTSDITCRRAESALRIDHGTVCYTGRMQGALAYYTCDTGYQLMVEAHGRSASPLRVCQENGGWNGTTSVTTCILLDGGPTIDAAMKLSEAGVGSTIAAASFVAGILSTAAACCCVVMLRMRQRQRSRHCHSDQPPPAPPLPPHQQQQQAKGKVDYEEISVVVADVGGSRIEMKTNVAYGPVQQKK